MSPGHCSCPDCGTILRVRDRSFIGRQIECPECQAKLQIAQDQDRKLIAERAKVERARRSDRPLVASKAIHAGHMVGTKLKALLHSPLVLAWALAIGVTTFVAILMLRPTVRLRVPEKKSALVDVVDDSKSSQSSPTTARPPEPVELQPPAAEVAAQSDMPPGQPVPESIEPSNPPAVPENSASPPPSDNSSTAVVNSDAKPSPVLPPPVVIDVEKQLTQRLQKFSTSQPVSRSELIELIEEMLGAPIRYNREELGEKNLDRPVSIDLEATTVGGVLKALIDPAGWDYVIENNGIKLKPRQVAGAS